MNGDNSETGLQIVQSNDNQMAFSLLLSDIKAIIKEARSAAYAGINAVQIDQNWKIGKRIVEEEQGGRIRAEYGKRTIAELSAHLCAEFGEGYSERNLRDFRAFYVIFPDSEIWHTRVPNLSWSHFRLIMRVSDPVAREWYINEASNEHWGVRTLDRNISTQYYERLLLSQTDRLPVIAEMKRKTAAFQKDKLEFIKNPSVLEFIGLHGKQGLVEDDLEKAILTHLQEFMLELERSEDGGSTWTTVASGVAGPQWFDETASTKKSYVYRLKANGASGYAYSSVVPPAGVGKPRGLMLIFK